MRWLRELFFRLQPIFRRRRIEADLADEIRHHLESLAERYVAAGMAPEEALQAARREFGGVEQMKESYRDARGFAALENLGRDLRMGLRSMRRYPGFSAVAIATLAVAIGVNATIFSLVNGVLLREPVPHEPAQVAGIYSAGQDAARAFRPFSHAEFNALRAEREVFADVAALHFAFVAVGADAALHRAFAFVVSENYLSLMGARPAAGRFFSPGECRPGAGERVVVASWELWQREGGRPDFIGSTLLINGRPHAVIGVAPPGFCGASAVVAPELWLPLGVLTETGAAFGEGRRFADLADPANYTLNLFGRLRPGITLASAGPRLPILAARLAAIDPRPGPKPRELILAKPFGLSPTPGDRRPMTLLGSLLLGMAAVVLLITCLNLANMLLARGTARAGEIAVRLALGASRARIVHQLLAEGLVLALAGGFLGCLLCAFANRLLQQTGAHLLDSMGFSLVLELRPDLAVIAATFAFCLVATLLFSLAPALKATRADLVRDLKSPGGGAGTAGGTAGRFFAGRHLLVMAQMTLSLVLVFAAGIFFRGALRAGGPEWGFQADGVALAEIDFSLANTPEPDARRRMLSALDLIRRLPGVQAAGLSTLVPYKNEITPVRLAPADTGPAIGRSGDGTAPRGTGAVLGAITPGFLDSLGVRLLRGRDFGEVEMRAKDSPRVCLVDEGLASKLFPAGDALGQRVRFAESEADAMEIVGITARHNQDVLDKDRPIPRCYVPLGQFEPAPAVFATVRWPRQDPAALLHRLDALRQELRQLDPDLPLVQLLPYPAYLEKSFNLWMGRIGATLFGAFGSIALLLAVLGVYGVKAYAVEQRTREIGIRIALGASRGGIFALIMRQGALQTAFSIALGLLLSLPVGRALAYFLYGVNAADPLVLAVASAVLGGATLLACLVPARRATRISPLRALRTE